MNAVCAVFLVDDPPPRQNGEEKETGQAYDEDEGPPQGQPQPQCRQM